MQLPAEVASSLVVTRYAAGSYVAGLWSEGATSTLTIRAFVEPAPAESMQALPEARRTTQGILVVTTTELLTADEINHKNADRIAYAGMSFEVATVDRLGHFKLAEAHYEILATRIQ